MRMECGKASKLSATRTVRANVLKNSALDVLQDLRLVVHRSRRSRGVLDLVLPLVEILDH